MFTGPVVTGSGPHAGDAGAERFGFFIPDVVRVHSINMWVFLAVVVVLLFRLARSGAPADILRRGYRLLVMIVVQGGIGYLQYELGIPGRAGPGPHRGGHRDRRPHGLVPPGPLCSGAGPVRLRRPSRQRPGSRGAAMTSTESVEVMEPGPPGRPRAGAPLGRPGLERSDQPDVLRRPGAAAALRVLQDARPTG